LTEYVFPPQGESRLACGPVTYGLFVFGKTVALPREGATQRSRIIASLSERPNTFAFECEEFNDDREREDMRASALHLPSLIGQHLLQRSVFSDGR
jgi:hypothetical protein